jgi:hypothetical protein
MMLDNAALVGYKGFGRNGWMKHYASGLIRRMKELELWKAECIRDVSQTAVAAVYVPVLGLEILLAKSI